MRKIGIWIIIVYYCYCDWCTFLPPGEAVGDLSGGRLLRHLLSKDRYDPRILPANPQTGKVTLDLSVVVNSINNLDDRDQWLTWVGYVNAELRNFAPKRFRFVPKTFLYSTEIYDHQPLDIFQSWNNPFLRWRPEDWNGTEQLLLKEKDMWVPDVSILERLDDDISFGDQRRRLIQLNNNGRIIWFLGGGTITTSCPINVRKFPFDHQTCHMHIGSYTISDKDVELIDSKDSHFDQFLGDNGLWKVESWTSTTMAFHYNTSWGLQTYPYLWFTLHLERKSAYFVLNIIIPVMVMALLMGMVFLLPSDGGEKIGFSITLLLAFNVMQLVIVDWMPQTSDSLPIIAFYVTSLLCLSALCIPASVFVIYIHNNGPSRLPYCLQKYLTQGQVRKQGLLQIHPEENEKNSEIGTRTGDVSEVQKLLLKELRRKHQRYEETLKENDEKENWKASAEIVDKFFFRTTISLIVSFTALFCILILI